MAYNTVTKKLITDYLKNNMDTTVTVEDINNHLKEEGNKVNITTVYRIMDKLYEEGHVMRFSDEDKKRNTYRYNSEESHCQEHLHLKCSSCGKIIHLDCDHSEKFIDHIYVKHGFKVKCESAILYGICDECLKKEQNKKKEK